MLLWPLQALHTSMHIHTHMYAYTRQHTNTHTHIDNNFEESLVTVSIYSIPSSGFCMYNSEILLRLSLIASDPKSSF